MTSDLPIPKQRYPRAAAIAVVRELLAVITPACERVIVAGSLRRKKPDVGDVELLFIPRVVSVPDPADMFGKLIPHSAVDLVLEELLGAGILAKRVGEKGGKSWGEHNKLAVHVASGIPVDLFSATAANWYNYLVCRTGGATTNTRIAFEARERGWKWNPYGEGFSRLSGPDRGRIKSVTCEADVFTQAGLPYQEPWERE